MSDHALFAIAPYVAAVIFILGTLRQLSRKPTTDAGTLFRGHRLAALALMLVAATHVATWISPGFLQTFNGSFARVMAIEIPQFVLGVIAAIGLVRVIVACLHRSKGLADTMLLGVLAVAIGSGLGMAVRYRWASTWSAVTLTPYVRSLFMLEPDARLLAMPYLIKLHVFSGIALLAVLPFTSVMHRVLLPIRRLIDRLVVPIANRAARRARQAGAWMSASGRALVWPDAEDED